MSMASHVNHASFSHRRSSYRPCHSLQTSAKSGAVTGAVQTNTSYFGTPIVRTAFLLSLFLPSFLPSLPPCFLEIAFYGHQETHVYLLSRGFRPEWTRRITTCSRATSEWQPRNTRARVGTVGTAVARTVDIQSNQETNGKAIR